MATIKHRLLGTEDVIDLAAVTLNNQLAVTKGGTGLATVAINNILYASALDTIAGLATGNNGVLVTGATGIPAIGTDLPTAVTIGSAYIHRVGGTDVAVADGGTGKSSWTQWLIPYADTTTSFAQIPIGASGQVLTSNGAGVAPTFQAGGGATDYDGLTDTPANKTGSALKFPQVNAGETAHIYKALDGNDWVDSATRLALAADAVTSDHLAKSLWQQLGLVAYYKLDEASGNRADATDNANTLTDVNTVLQGAALITDGGNSADFEAGNSESLSITDANQKDLNITNQLSICAWVNVESFTGNGVIVGKYLTIGNQRAYLLQTLSPDAFRFILSHDGSATGVYNLSSTSFAIATTYFVVVTWDGAYGRIYVNGTLNAGPTAYNNGAQQGIFDSTAPFELGALNNGGGNFYDGLMDEVTIWNRALSNAEITWLYNAGSGRILF